jgi:hypothetical protein
MIANRVKGQMAGGFNIVSSKKGSVLKDVRKCISSKKT